MQCIDKLYINNNASTHIAVIPIRMCVCTLNDKGVLHIHSM